MPSRFGSPAKCLEQSDTHVLDVCMCDFTGPVLVNLWGDLALEFLDKISKIEPPVILRFGGMRATKLANNAWNGPRLTSIHAFLQLAFGEVRQSGCSELRACISFQCDGRFRQGLLV